MNHRKSTPLLETSKPASDIKRLIERFHRGRPITTRFEQVCQDDSGLKLVGSGYRVRVALTLRDLDHAFPIVFTPVQHRLDDGEAQIDVSCKIEPEIAYRFDRMSVRRVEQLLENS